MLAILSSEKRTIPDLANKNFEALLEKAPVIAHAMLRFATEVSYLAPVIDAMLADNHIRKFIHSRLQKVAMVEDVISELAYFAWLQSKKFPVDYKEEVGEPDGTVDFAGQLLHVEVKTLHD